MQSVVPLKDFLLVGTPLRALILRNDFCHCAYLGVPEDHWLANMQDLEFDCHFGLTFSGAGGDGIRPAGWFWYGWDYAHYLDQLDYPPELLAALKKSGISNQFNKGKRWTVEELEMVVIEAAQCLMESLSKAQALAAALIAKRAH